MAITAEKGYKCSVCNGWVERDFMVYLDHTKKHIIDEIRKEHPGWVEKDGTCPRCVDYFERAFRGKA